MGKPIGSQWTYPMNLKNVCGIGTWALTVLFGTLFGLVLAPNLHAQALSTSSSPVSGNSPAQPADSVAEMLRAAYQDFAKGDLDAALDKVNGVIKLNSQNKQAFLLRASIYAQQKQWDKADYDYEVALVNDPNDAIAKFDLAELKFMQKKYDDARPGFAKVQGDKELGDFAAYKVFLCDLFGAHEDVAARELEAFNHVGGNPSYYFGNAAWDLAHNKTEDGADWLKSAARIYANSPQKFSNYTRSLTSLAYLPIHLSSTQ
jgi:predicted Zn-dependent protease